MIILIILLFKFVNHTKFYVIRTFLKFRHRALLNNNVIFNYLKKQVFNGFVVFDLKVIFYSLSCAILSCYLKACRSIKIMRNF